MGNKEKFTMISKKERKEVEEILFEAVKDHFQVETLPDGYFKYEAELQNMKFVTCMSDDEMKKCIVFTVDILEEMKTISNNNGINRQYLNDLKQKITSKHKFTEPGFDSIIVWNEIESDKIKEIIVELNQLRRVGGAYALMLANPVFKSTLYSVYCRLLDCVNDDDIYLKCGYFLLRAIMKMNSTSIDDIS